MADEAFNLQDLELIQLVSLGEIMDFIYGAELTAGGCTLPALPSRNREGKPNIVEACPTCWACASAPRP